ncbi:hypothetical protein SKAU_G00213950 [Synaphobranchus kaupii]|uniref:Uncharacterized protein n=1 Tax=Synaphobranchus kaupii TaxID=118154 RepID=A0A9Q1F9G7_SYNKA|nr:hypothetical protein SKAU_G00213950 [Synaphobranchus kaupii]
MRLEGAPGATVVSHSTFPIFSLLGEDRPDPHVACIGVHDEGLLGIDQGPAEATVELAVQIQSLGVT